MATRDELGDAADPEALTATSNPYLDFYRAFCAQRPGELTRVFDPSLDEEKRAEMYAALDVGVAMKYAWAIPDERALRIIKHFGPIVEMGAGNGYWAKLLQLRGVDIVCYDLHVDGEDEGEEDGDNESSDRKDAGGEESREEEEDGGDDGEDAEAQDDEDGGEEADEEEEDEEDVEDMVEVEQILWSNVLKGTPKDLRKHSDRALFLCYPDDFEDSDESMALESLNNYAGDTVIHVGELFGETVCLPGPWGRTSSKEFQIHLASVYHKVLQVPLPSWHSSLDSLTVWKRTKTSIVDNGFYAYIPAEERIDLTASCPAMQHLLRRDGDEEGDTASGPLATDTKAQEPSKPEGKQPKGKRKRKRSNK